MRKSLSVVLATIVLLLGVFGFAIVASVITTDCSLNPASLPCFLKSGIFAAAGILNDKAPESLAIVFLVLISMLFLARLGWIFSPNPVLGSVNPVFFLEIPAERIFENWLALFLNSPNVG